MTKGHPCLQIPSHSVCHILSLELDMLSLVQAKDFSSTDSYSYPICIEAELP